MWQESTDRQSARWGLKWTEVGSKKPQTGAEINNGALASALREKRKFSTEEWDKFDVSHVSCDSYIKVGDKYFQPAVLCGLIRLQRWMRAKSSGPSGTRLHAQHLGDRLVFEQGLVRGVFRLMNQLLMFFAIIYALELGAQKSGPSVQRGIYDNLKDSFGFDSLLEIKSREGLVDALPKLSRAAKKYMARSSLYFDAKGTGDVELIGDLKSFSTPEVLGGVDLTILSRTISFTAWIKTTPQFLRGYLIRKRPTAEPGETSELACWGWLLDADSGPQLHLGAHDFFPIPPLMANAASKQVCHFGQRLAHTSLSTLKPSCNALHSL